MGFKAPDDKWHKMKAVYDACDAANVDIPDEVTEYFDCQIPDPAGVTVDLDNITIEWCDLDRSRSGIDIFLKDLPADISSIRFYNCW